MVIEVNIIEVIKLAIRIILFLAAIFGIGAYLWFAVNYIIYVFKE